MNYIHPNAKKGDNVTIGPFSYIAEHVEIGDGNRLFAIVRRVGEDAEEIAVARAKVVNLSADITRGVFRTESGSPPERAASRLARVVYDGYGFDAGIVLQGSEDSLEIGFPGFAGVFFFAVPGISVGIFSQA